MDWIENLNQWFWVVMVAALSMLIIDPTDKTANIILIVGPVLFLIFVLYLIFISIRAFYHWWKGTHDEFSEY